ncbi:MAG: hypothetical protein QW360_00585 [Thermofilum sp.]
MGNDDNVYYELYGEYISLRELGVVAVVSTALALIFYSIAPYVASTLRMPQT